jgi:hypothetical protein
MIIKKLAEEIPTFKEVEVDLPYYFVADDTYFRINEDKTIHKVSGGYGYYSITKTTLSAHDMSIAKGKEVSKYDFEVAWFNVLSEILPKVKEEMHSV